MGLYAKILANGIAHLDIKSYDPIFFSHNLSKEKKNLISIAFNQYT